MVLVLVRGLVRVLVLVRQQDREKVRVPTVLAQQPPLGNVARLVSAKERARSLQEPRAVLPPQSQR